MERKFSGIKFRNFGYSSRGCPNVSENRNNRKIRKLMFHSKKIRFPVPLCRKFLEIPSESEWNGSVQPG